MGEYVLTYMPYFLSQTNQEISKPKLAPLNEGGVSELLNKVRYSNLIW